MNPCACEPDPIPSGSTVVAVQSIDAIGGGGDDQGTAPFDALMPSQRGSLAWRTVSGCASSGLNAFDCESQSRRSDGSNDDAPPLPAPMLLLPPVLPLPLAPSPPAPATPLDVPAPAPLVDEPA